MRLDEIAKDPVWRERFLARVQAELSQTLLNCIALDVAGDMLIESSQAKDKALEELGQEKAALLEKSTNDHNLIGELRERAEKAEGRKRSSA